MIPETKKWSVGGHFPLHQLIDISVSFFVSVLPCFIKLISVLFWLTEVIRFKFTFLEWMKKRVSERERKVMNNCQNELFDYVSFLDVNVSYFSLFAFFHLIHHNFPCGWLCHTHTQITFIFFHRQESCANVEISLNKNSWYVWWWKSYSWVIFSFEIIWLLLTSLVFSFYINYFSICHQSFNVKNHFFLDSTGYYSHNGHFTEFKARIYSFKSKLNRIGFFFHSIEIQVIIIHSYFGYGY